MNAEERLGQVGQPKRRSGDEHHDSERKNRVRLEPQERFRQGADPDRHGRKATLGNHRDYGTDDDQHHADRGSKPEDDREVGADKARLFYPGLVNQGRFHFTEILHRFRFFRAPSFRRIHACRPPPVVLMSGQVKVPNLVRVPNSPRVVHGSYSFADRSDSMPVHESLGVNPKWPDMGAEKTLTPRLPKPKPRVCPSYAPKGVEL
ncbi:hypothetical protein NITHO_3010004 [Nitrolancea hollandica Lb]|uniref:Uncharacterized protein n=1 Tax=Nitrolancea hollandica Lb TaxID=1129897 RepID=I4EH61_9BACT|nr:hypothetical protein NITHO_3010004 [Nitrolancea hollandica Lb]